MFAGHALAVGTGGVYLGAAEPIVRFDEQDQGADERVWDFFPENKVFKLRTLNNAGSVGVNALEVLRGTGTAITSVSFPNGKRRHRDDESSPEVGCGRLH